MRYAAPPLGNLRFRAPVTPLGGQKIFNDGSKAVICPQARPPWTDGITKWLANGTAAFNISAGYTPPVITAMPPADLTVSEDCLFLDIMVPKSILDSANDRKAPVLVEATPPKS